MTTSTFVRAIPDSFAVQWPGNMEFGPGCSARLPEILHGLGTRRALLLSDAGLAVTGHVERIGAMLRGAGMQIAVYGGIEPNPQTRNVAEAYTLWRELGADTLIALGGGSVIDAGKLLSLRIASDEELDELITKGDNAAVRPVPPYIAIPTTAGTGSESTTASLLKDSLGRKRVMRSVLTRPCHVLLDPELTMTVPTAITASTGFDVLMHALGALGTTIRNPVGNTLAMDALNLAMHALPRAVECGNDAAARSEMLLASYLAGVAIASNGVDAIHGLCTPLESHVSRPHGHVLSAVFPHVMRHNLPAMEGRYALAARRCGVARIGHADREAAHLLYARLCVLREQIGLDFSLKDFGIEASMLPALLPAALESRATRINVRPLAAADIMTLYAAML